MFDCCIGCSLWEGGFLCYELFVINVDKLLLGFIDIKECLN